MEIDGNSPWLRPRKRPEKNILHKTLREVFFIKNKFIKMPRVRSSSIIRGKSLVCTMITNNLLERSFT